MTNVYTIICNNHLELIRQIMLGFPLDNDGMDDYVSAGDI